MTRTWLALIGTGLFVATAHPGKFREVVEPAIGRIVPLPRPLQEALGRPRHSVSMNVDYRALRNFILDGSASHDANN